MAVMLVKTKGNDSPKGKPRVYFTCHPEDFDKYFDRVCKDIFQTQDCAIFYTKDMNQDIPEQDKVTDLESHNLFVVPVTFRLLHQPNRAMDGDIPYALEKSSTWNTDKDYTIDLYGYKYANLVERDHNALIIWSGCIEDMGLRIDDPVYSLDILPTLSNLFGTEFDSRLMPGRDVFSDAPALVYNYSYDWKTEYGTYISSTNTFTPVSDDLVIPEGYVEQIKAIVRNRIRYSSSVLNVDYMEFLFGEN